MIGSCGSSNSSACRELREPTDPASFLHVIDPGTATFLTNPPTSGPHVSGAVPLGVLEEPIDPAIQVSILESGSALVQYDGSLDAVQIETLTSMSNDNLVVAPGLDLPAPVVATAWTWMLTCAVPDSTRLTEFIDRRVGDAPGSD